MLLIPIVHTLELIPPVPQLLPLMLPSSLLQEQRFHGLKAPLLQSTVRSISLIPQLQTEIKENLGVLVIPMSLDILLLGSARK
jgi:hypothetical protein